VATLLSHEVTLDEPVLAARGTAAACNTTTTTTIIIIIIIIITTTTTNVYQPLFFSGN